MLKLKTDLSFNKKFSDKQEKLIASSLGWVQVSGSGSRPNLPGDVESDIYLGECKTHTTPGHSINFKFSVWDKIEEEAYSRFKKPVLFVDDGSQKLDHTYCMVKLTGVSLDDIPHGCDISDASKHQSFTLPNNIDTVIFKRYSNLFMILPFDRFSQLLG